MADALTPRLLARVGLTNWRQNIIYIGFVGIFIFFAVTLGHKGFLDSNNLLNIVRQTAPIAIMAVAMTYVLAAGEIDLSIGAVAGLASVATAMAMDIGGVPLAIFAGIATGLIVGILNGIISTRIGIPTFLTTLAMMGVAKGTSMWVSGTKAVPILSDGYNWFFGGGYIGPLPVLLFWMLIVAVIGHIVLRRSTFGRWVLATGGSETAARYSGVNTRNIKFKVLIISSTAAAIAGMLYAGRFQTGRFQLGEGDELSVIAAAVLVLDVAVRRLAFDRDAAREMAQGVVGATAQSTGETVAAWRAARTRAASRGSRAGPGTAQAQPSEPAARPPASSPGAAAPGPNESASSGSDGSDDTPLARLRRAKRRARDGEADSEGQGQA